MSERERGRQSLNEPVSELSFVIVGACLSMSFLRSFADVFLSLYMCVCVCIYFESVIILCPGFANTLIA